jgi:hypothetical protein
VTNGAVADTSAQILGGVGVNLGGSGKVVNYGVIEASNSQGVVLYAGGNVTNGTVIDTHAYIGGVEQGVGLVVAGTVTNFGAIKGLGVAYGDTGVELNNGGFVTNGANSDLGATISGYTGVLLGGPGAVVNYGTIRGMGASGQEYGVSLTKGGTVFNGGAEDRTALIQGLLGVEIIRQPGTIQNGGTILGVREGVDVTAGGEVANGSLNNPGALIQGYTGLYLGGGGAATNYGTISGLGDGRPGVYVYFEGTIVNCAGALIEGASGLTLSYGSVVTVTNFGTIEGTGGTAVDFVVHADVLNVEAGSTFIGAVRGEGGTLNLASGTGTIGAFAAGDLTVSGSMAQTTFLDFDTVIVSAGATFADTGGVSVVAGQVLDVAGTLTIGATGAGSIVNTGLIETTGGVLTLAGGVTGSGKASINGGTLEAMSSFSEAVTFAASTGVLELAQSQGYTGSITGFSTKGGTSLDLVDIGFVTASEATYSGTTKGGVLTVTDGTHTAKINLVGNYIKSTFTASSDGHGGTIVVDPKSKTHPALASATPHPFVAAMAVLGGSPATAIHPGAVFIDQAATSLISHFVSRRLN